MATLLALLPAPGHDQLWFLLMAHRWLAGNPLGPNDVVGAQLYGPVAFDSNPPGIVWLSALPILLAQALHLSTTFTAKLLVILAESATSLLSLYFLRKSRGIRAPYELPALLFAAFILFYLAPARDFGQRDHILSFLILPYILAAAVPSRTQSQTIPRCLAGILAAVGICLKPHHALIILAVELAIMLFPSFFTLRSNTLDQPAKDFPSPGAFALPGVEGPFRPLSENQTDRAAPLHNQALSMVGHDQVPQGFSLGQGSLGQGPVKEDGALVPGRKPSNNRPRLASLIRPETVVLAAIGLIFLDAIHRLTPLYFTLALPTLRETYWAIGHLSIPALLLQAIELCAIAAFSISLFARTRPRSPAVALLLIAGTAATIAYLIQGTGWYYQQLPAIALFGSALTLQLLYVLAARPRTIPNWLTPATATLCVLALTLTAHFTNYPFTTARIYAPIFAGDAMPDPTLFTPNTSVAILTTSVEAAMMPTERYHLTWAQRTNNLWLLPAILRSESPGDHAPRHTIPPARLAALDAMQHRWMVEDLTRWHPTLILVERCQDPGVHCQELEDRHDNLLAWFQRDPAFSTLWSHYTYTGDRGHFGAYTLTH